MEVLKNSKNDNKSLFFKFLGQTSKVPMLLEIERAQGVWLYGPLGESYMDLVSGVSVSNIGHTHPAVVEAIKNQAERYSHLMVYGEYIQAPQIQYAALLCAQLPSSLQNVYFVNSGSESIEAALKLAKRVTGRRELIGFNHAYHGSTHGALSFIGDEYYKNSFRPLLPAVRQLKFNDFESLNQITSRSAAVVVEPIQAEAGVVVPHPGFLEALRERCTQTGTILIFDEVQTGFGRVGALFAFQKYGVVPDILCLAKALGGGMPLGAIVAAHTLMNAWCSNPELGHITTFGGHPVCCAAGMASLQIILAGNLPELVEEKGKRFIAQLKNHPLIKEIRGTGLLLACELGNQDKASQFIRIAMEEGVVLDRFLFAGSAFRISPPITISFEEIDKACKKIIKSLNKL